MAREYPFQKIPLRYGENRYQSAELWLPRPNADPLAIGKLADMGGSALSATNITDIDRAITTMTFATAAFEVNAGPKIPFAIALAVKHGNCCGAAYSTSPQEALLKMINGDRKAIFGGCVALNFEVDEHVAEMLLRYGLEPGVKRRILDIVLAPNISKPARELLARNEGKCKMRVNSALGKLSAHTLDASPRHRPVRGGEIVQDPYSFVLNFKTRKVKRVGPPVSREMKLDLAFAAALCTTSNSNTISLVQEGMLIGQGVAQTRRDTAAWLAVEIARRNGHNPINGHTVACSDSFFPFPDGLEVLTDARVDAVFATTGSINDKAVLEHARKAGITFYHLPDAEARMFFGH